MTAAYLYLAEIVDIGVKVGISRNPTNRLASHARDASAYGRKLGRTWVSPVSHTNARENESAIKGGSRREYLARDFDDCLAQAQALPMVEAAEEDPTQTPLNRFLGDWFPGFGEWLKKEAGR